MIYICMYRFVYGNPYKNTYANKCVCGITWPKNTQSQFGAVSRPVTPVLIILLYARASFSMVEKEAEQKRSLRNEKLKVNRASETGGQRKERLRIRNEKDRARRTKKNYKRKIKGRQNQKITGNGA